ncbi:Protein unc-80 [Cichlidogyrus casuarinus]|uniref:Protein unc-80 n=1 Tax=Cichlidogyrus casuarinus TaxID=1844966 RepID=A0ABD2QF00_9PLAT
MCFGSQLEETHLDDNEDMSAESEVTEECVVASEFPALTAMDQRQGSARIPQGPLLSERGGTRSLTRVTQMRNRSIKVAKHGASMRQGKHQSSVNESGELDEECSVRMPWIKTCIEFANFTHFGCEHVTTCANNCYDRQQHQCRELMSAMRRVYASTVERSLAFSLDQHGEVVVLSNALAARNMVDEKKGKPRHSVRRMTNVVISGLGVGNNSDMSEVDQRFANLVALGGSGDGNEMEIPSALLQKLLTCNMETENERRHFFSRGSKRKDSSFFLSLFANSGQTSAAEPAFGNCSQRGSVIFQSFAQSSIAGEESEQGPPPTPIPCGQEPRNVPMLRYLSNQVKNFAAVALTLFNKSAILMTENDLKSVLPMAWELLMEEDPEVSTAAASLVLFCAVKCPETVKDLLFRELCHSSAEVRLNGMLRFRILWKSRYQVWSRLEANAANYLKLPPAFVEFVLPSPTLGHPGMDVPDPDWQIKRGTSAEEVQLKQNEATKTFVTASTTRRKQQQELLARAISAEVGHRKAARQRYHLTNCFVLERAAVEYSFSNRGVEHRDDSGATMNLEDTAVSTCGPGTQISSPMQEEFNAVVRRLSVAPINRSNAAASSNQTPSAINLANRTMSWRQGSFSLFCTGNQELHPGNPSGP